MINRSSEILQKSNKKLRKISSEVDEISFGIRKLIVKMKRIVLEENGAGLAAPQVGANLRVIVLYVDGKIMVMINPKIESASSDFNIDTEACLSVRGESGKVSRHNWVFIEYMDIDGEKGNIYLSDFEARCAQHEIDHLNGILYIDKLEK